MLYATGEGDTVVLSLDTVPPLFQGDNFWPVRAQQKCDDR